MGDLFASWRDRIDANSERAVDLYVRELAGFREIAITAKARAAMLDFAVFLRRRTISLIAEDLPFTEADLSSIAAIGRDRAASGISFAAQRDVLRMHHSLMLREVDEAAGRHDLDDVMRTLAWWPTRGLTAPAAYTRGYLLGQGTVLPEVERVRQLTRLIVADDPAAAELAGILAVPVPDRPLVVVCRVPGESRIPDDRFRAEALRHLLSRQRIPLSWEEPGEFVAVVADAAAAARMVRDFVESTGLPVAVGASHATGGRVAAAFAGARELSRVAPVRPAPGTVHYLTDLFAEVGANRLPPVDGWLREVSGRLATGPRLVGTLDAFYRNDMSRSRTAASLNIHPRTLDYRLSRVRDLTGLDPVSVRGVRILSTVVNRALAAPS
ncbi:helix-turn-helix domain-containing protein [Amycolatopsis oliviviridis]|uniref:Transcriptional regulator n=1 Tax=Amycolatopsis oliviviridis TaxID=1471590 RepID=A0ABQ3L2I5_9PSEU|nr:helix-turn-helix domain-containing protein [Amycolatopsis oliviviridis]GHH00901.1 transcriptional regulator [Amycolatopsis oliviviridis]